MNIEKYKSDIDALILEGGNLMNSMQFEVDSEKFDEGLKKLPKVDAAAIVKALVPFRSNYQAWYSESLSVIKVILPDRLQDFTRLFEKPKNRKGIQWESYSIEDSLQGITISLRGERLFGMEAAVPQLAQQLAILKATKRRFESSLFDIKRVVQADLFDSELDSAIELNKNGFARGAGAIAGVVLEKHLLQVCETHNIKIARKNPTINELNQALKDNNVIDVKDWRYIQLLGDIRNTCDHGKANDPTVESVNDLITGVKKNNEDSNLVFKIKNCSL